jgi:PTH1 family peptidyl-tRNA hydrolase
MAIKLIVGLSNPGPQYQDTRHNAGNWFVSKLASDYQTTLKIDTKFKSLVGQIQVGSNTCKLAIPTTYMNLSGDAVLALSRFYSIDPSEILIAHDELDLPAGVVRLKLEGGHGGHNGLRDIFAKLGTRAFYRLRIGIGHPGHKDDVTDYVLHKPSVDEKKRILEGLDSAIAVLPQLLQGEFDQAMKLLHTN